MSEFLSLASFVLLLSFQKLLLFGKKRDMKKDERRSFAFLVLFVLLFEAFSWASFWQNQGLLKLQKTQKQLSVFFREKGPQDVSFVNKDLMTSKVFLPELTRAVPWLLEA